MVDRTTYELIADGDFLKQGYFNTKFNSITKFISTLYGDSVISDCEITQQSTPNQTAQMSSGEVYINGVYYSILAVASINFGAADVTNPRYDLVSVNSSGAVTVTAGTAAVAPSVPTLPVNEVPLAVVYRAANDNVINTVDIADSRRLIGTPFTSLVNSFMERDTNSYTSFTSKTITIPAYRCRKYLSVSGDVGSYFRYVSAGLPASQQLQMGRITVTDSSGTTVIIVADNTLRITSSGDFQLADSSSSSMSATITDLDFTDTITVTLEIKGDKEAGNDWLWYATNNFLEVKGE